MILRAQAVGEHPSVRFVIRNVRNNLMWDGESFVDDFDQARKFWHPSDACGEMQDILKAHFRRSFDGRLSRRRPGLFAAESCLFLGCSFAVFREWITADFDRLLATKRSLIGHRFGHYAKLKKRQTTAF